MSERIFVHLVPGLPVPEFVTPCLEGWSVQICAGLTFEGRLNAYNHALEHIANNDWEKKDAAEIEAMRHK